MKKLIITTLLFSFIVQGSDLVGKQAPFFDLPDQNGKFYNLNDYEGQWLVVYFYPKDDTPGCTTEAINFTKYINQFDELETKIVGVSVDSIASHKKFSSKYDINFTLLADKDAVMANDYQVLKKIPLMNYASRQTFIINPKGQIVKHYKKVKPETHAENVLMEMKKLNASES